MKTRTLAVALALVSLSVPSFAQKRRAVRSVAPTPQSQTIGLFPARDATLYESTSGSVANGAGRHLFAGTTKTNAKRRGLLVFDIAGSIPSGSTITSAVLTMTVSNTIAGPESVTLHRVTSAWGEGTSNAGASNDGDGATSTPNDATWIHTLFPNSRWITPGGDFDAAPDGQASVASSTGVWQSPAMTTRVQQWLDNPATNHGWIVVGPETRPTTAKRFDSREHPTAALWPTLTVTYTR
jgi:hypothetical protein